MKSSLPRPQFENPGKELSLFTTGRSGGRSTVRIFPVRAALIVASLGALLPASSGLAQERERIVTLGEDLTAAQQREVLDLLGATQQDRRITVSSEETTRGSRGIIEIPPGTPAISSTATTCRPEGSGLDVRVQNIEEVTAGMYAQSLLTAGITDADVRVAAPSDAPAEGLTALTGIFKAYRLSPCTSGRLDPDRERLAQRELATTVELGEAMGDREAASEVVLQTQEQVVSRQLRSRAEIEQVVDQQLERRGGADVSDAVRDRLIALMVDLGAPDIDYGGYSRGFTVERVNRNRVKISAQPAGDAPDGAGDTVRGTVRGIRANGIVVQTDGETENISVGDDVEVVRDGRPAELRDIQRTDRVVVERNAQGRATRIVATSMQGGENARGRVITGTVATAGATALAVRTQGGTENVRLPNTDGLEVVRNGREATVRDIQPGDRVVVTLAADGRPSRIVATSQATASTGGGDSGPNPAWLLTLLPLFLLMRSDRDEYTITQRQNVRDQ